MVRFAPSQEEDLRPATLAQLFVVVAMILGVLTLAAIFVNSSLASFPATVFHTSLSDIGNWVDRSGRPTVMRGRVAEKLGFTSVDLRVRELGFREPSEELTHVCSTPDLLGFDDTIFLALVNESTGDALVWRASRKGDLISTARFENGVATSISNNSAQTGFVAEKEYFLKKLRNDMFRNLPPIRDTLLTEPPPSREPFLPKSGPATSALPSMRLGDVTTLPDRVERVMQTSQFPLHFRKLAQAVNPVELAARKANERSVGVALSRDKRFRPLGRTGFWALANRGPVGSWTVSDLAEDALTRREKPMTEAELFALVSEKRPVSRNAIRARLFKNPRFVRVAPKLWALAKGGAGSLVKKAN